ncbi:FimV family protein [Undibacterium sp. FT79W]|nr:FimV/HubP family polar landmark protein [Undibacterium sp. FT79W]MBC3877129.1 FimV family protein [Undibacterium sp. FT79W]
MHKQKRTSVTSLGRKVLSIAVTSSLLLMSQANATGMGRLTVLSSLGQPLRAEIELTSPSKDEIGSLVPKLASAEAFRQANIDFNAALLSLRFAVEPRGSGYVIKVTSSQAMNEPFVDMLLEMNSSNGKLLREYTFLLDPAELRNSQSPQLANPTVVANKRQAGTTSEVATRVPAQATAAVSPKSSVQVKEAAAPAQAQTKAGDYAVKKGDTLMKVASAYRSEGVSLDQMLVSLYKANPQAFVGQNMNRLKAGQILSIPDSDAIQASAGNASGAHSVVLAHAADFNAYRNKLADHVDRAPAEKGQAAKQTASGTITAKVKETPSATSESADKLKLSKSANTATKTSDGKGLPEEDKLAKNKAAAEAAGRLKELEKNVSDLQRLLDVKNKDLAAKELELNAKAKAEQKSAPASATVATVGKAEVASNAVSPAERADVASAPASVVDASPASATTAANKPARRKPVAPPPPPPEPSFFESISDFLLPGGAVALALLAGAGLWFNNKKKKAQQFEDSILTGSSMKANSMFGSTGGQSVDTNNSVFNSNFAPSASQLDANEVDPVAEADVYIAYGRDSQAEEILKEALRTQPDRHAVRVKLLEIYSSRKDTKLFERLASELYGMTGGEGEEWAQAASMGIALEPGNPLYAGGKAIPEASVQGGLGATTQPLEDLDPDALLANSLSRDMLDAISIIDTASHGQAATSEAGKDVVSDIDADHAASLDFDLGLSEADVPQIPEAQPVAPVATVDEQVPDVDFGSIDFDFGDNKPVVEEVAAVAESGSDQEIASDVAADLDFASLDFDVPAIEAAPVEHGLLDAQVADEHVDPVAEVVAETSETAEQDHGSAFEFDLSGIDLDLPSDDAHKSAEVELAPAVVEEQIEENAEMSTKLDLAVAYHEIGDKDGARELLDEVLKGGTASQKERASAMLAQMA